MIPVGCPPLDRLAAYLVGNLPLSELNAVADHLETCSRCQAAAADLDRHQDSLIDQLHTPSFEKVAENTQAIRVRAVERLLPSAVPMPPPNAASRPLGDRPPEEGDLLGPYRLEHKLGQGGMGMVFVAEHTSLGRKVAVKLLPAHRAAEESARQRFRREALAAGRLDHPNIVRALDAGDIQGVMFLAMEVLDGFDLGRITDRLGTLPLASACEVARQAALGLHHAHEAGLVHRDVKPSNLFLTVGHDEEPPRVKVLDLGLALLADLAVREDLRTESDTLLGTKDYMAPEQWDDTHAVDRRTDVYALGCTLFHLLIGRPPFAGTPYHTVLRKMRAHLYVPMPSPRSVRPEVPLALEAVIARMMAKKPEDRFASAADAAQGLEPFCSGANLAGLLEDAKLAEASGIRPKDATLNAGSTASFPSERLEPPLPGPDPAGMFQRPRPWSRRSWLTAVGVATVGVGGLVWWGSTSSCRADACLFGRHGSDVEMLDVSPDGRRIVSGSLDGTVVVWELATRRELWRRTVEGLRGLMFGPAADVLVVATRSGVKTIAISDNGAETLISMARPIFAICLSADGQWAVAAAGLDDQHDNEIILIDVARQESVARLTDPKSTRSVSMVVVGPGGERVAVGHTDGQVDLWEPHVDRVRRLPTRWMEHPIVGLGLNLTGDRLMAADDEYAYLWDLTGEAPREVCSPIDLDDQTANRSVLTPNGRWLLATFPNGRVKLWDAVTGKESGTLSGFAAGYGLVVTLDSTRVLVGGADGTVWIGTLPAPSGGA